MFPLPDDVIRYRIVETPPAEKRHVRTCVAGAQIPQCEYGYHLKTGTKFRIYNQNGNDQQQQPNLTLQHKTRMQSTSAAPDVTSAGSKAAGTVNTGTL